MTKSFLDSVLETLTIPDRPELLGPSIDLKIKNQKLRQAKSAPQKNHRKDPRAIDVLAAERNAAMEILRNALGPDRYLQYIGPLGDVSVQDLRKARREYQLNMKEGEQVVGQK